MSSLVPALKRWMGDRSPEMVAPSFGVVPNTVRNWLSGLHEIPKSKRALVASVIGVAVDGRKSVAHAPRRSRSGAA